MHAGHINYINLLTEKGTMASNVQSAFSGPVQNPVVNGNHWWQYVAPLENWPVCLGHPDLVSEVRLKLMKLFKATLPPGQAGPAQLASVNPGCQTLISASEALISLKLRIYSRCFSCIEHTLGGNSFKDFQCHSKQKRTRCQNMSYGLDALSSRSIETAHLGRCEVACH